MNLDPEYVRAGGKLLPGFYSAQDGQSGTSYPALEVTKDSPEVLLFRLPPPITYRGRVLDGTTGKPMPGAFVIAHSEDRGEGLLRLKDEDWAGLETLPAGTAKDNRALNPLRNHYSFRSLVRTDEQGQYEIREPASLRSSSLMAFARNRLPCFQRTTTLARTPEDKSPLADLPLFPAARVTVQPVTQTSESVAPEWEFPAEGQPEWLARLNALVRGPASGPQIGRPNLLQTNHPQTLFVPAGVRLTLTIRAPYNDRLSTARVDKPIQLPPGGALDVGQVTFEPALSVALRVTGPDGKPVSGVPLRRIYFPDDRWSVACTTDSDGLARFYVRKNSHGYFSVPNILPSSFVRAHPGRATIPFQIEATVPAEPLSIPLTASQVQALPGRPIADIPR
ncbi:MAG: hypothetical protein NT031_09405 [Planctomycetota bacterium]|nr:hypothetical protein [Planctomycetota bacterium]